MITFAEHALAAAQTELSRADGRLCACFPVDITLQVIHA